MRRAGSQPALVLRQISPRCNLRLTSDDPRVGVSRAFSSRRRTAIARPRTGYGALSIHRKGEATAAYVSLCLVKALSTDAGPV